MPLVFLLVMVQVITTGGIFAMPRHARDSSRSPGSTPSRWGFAASASTVDLNAIPPQGSTARPAAGITPRTRGCSTSARWWC